MTYKNEINKLLSSLQMRIYHPLAQDQIGGCCLLPIYLITKPKIAFKETLVNVCQNTNCASSKMKNY